MRPASENSFNCTTKCDKSFAYAQELKGPKQLKSRFSVQYVTSSSYNIVLLVDMIFY